MGSVSIVLHHCIHLVTLHATKSVCVIRDVSRPTKLISRSAKGGKAVADVANYRVVSAVIAFVE